MTGCRDPPWPAVITPCEKTNQRDSAGCCHTGKQSKLFERRRWVGFLRTRVRGQPVPSGENAPYVIKEKEKKRESDRRVCAIETKEGSRTLHQPNSLF